MDIEGAAAPSQDSNPGGAPRARSARAMHSTSKLLAVLRLFTASAPEWTVEESAEALGMPVSTAYRYFRELNEAGLIGSSSAGRYILGPAILELDRQTRLQDPLIRAGKPVMAGLKEDVAQDGVILLCRLYRQQVMCVHQELVGAPAFGVSFERGLPLPLHRGAASKVILAALPARLAKAYQLAHAQDVAAVGLGADWAEMKARLRALRSAKVCVTRAEVDAGVVGFGAAIFDGERDVIGSIGLVVPQADSTPRSEQAFAALIRAAAQAITHNLQR